MKIEEDMFASGPASVSAVLPQASKGAAGAAEPAKAKRSRWGAEAPAPAATAVKAEPAVKPEPLTPAQQIAEQTARIQAQIAEKLKSLPSQLLAGLGGGQQATAASLGQRPTAASLSGSVASAAAPPAIPAMIGGLAVAPPPGASSLAAATLAKLQKQNEDAKKWMPLVLNKEGKQVDAEGKIIHVERQVATLRVRTPRVCVRCALSTCAVCYAACLLASLVARCVRSL